MSRFPKPETVVLAISRGDTITVRKRLTAGEHRAALQRMYAAHGDGSGPRLNMLQTGLAIVTAYLLDWTLTDDGEPVPIRGLPIAELESILNAVDPDTFTEIKDAIQAHENRMTLAREEEKKLPAGATSSDPISSSRSEPDGPSTTSVPLIPMNTPNSRPS